MRNGDYQLAVSDIFGSDAFLPVLCLLATVLSGKAALPQAQNTDIYLTALEAADAGAHGRPAAPQRRIARMGVDSLVILVLYAVGIAGLFASACSG